MHANVAFALLQQSSLLAMCAVQMHQTSSLSIGKQAHGRKRACGRHNETDYRSQYAQETNQIAHTFLGPRGQSVANPTCEMV